MLQLRGVSQLAEFPFLRLDSTLYNPIFWIKNTPNSKISLAYFFLLGRPHTPSLCISWSSLSFNFPSPMPLVCWISCCLFSSLSFSYCISSSHHCTIYVPSWSYIIHIFKNPNQLLTILVQFVLRFSVARISSSEWLQFHVIKADNFLFTQRRLILIL